MIGVRACVEAHVVIGSQASQGGYNIGLVNRLRWEGPPRVRLFGLLGASRGVFPFSRARARAPARNGKSTRFSRNWPFVRKRARARVFGPVLFLVFVFMFMFVSGSFARAA